MRISLVGLFIGLVMTSAFAQDTILSKEQEQAARQIHQSIFSSSPFNRERLRSLTAAEQLLLHTYYRADIEQRKREGQTDDSLMGSSFVLNMALLGDDWAREMVVRNFWKQPRTAPTRFEILQDPKVVPMIGEGLFMNEALEIHGDVGYMPTQANVARVILHTLRNSPDFSEEVRAWAQRIGQDYTMTMMREWYRTNETALKAWDFKAVRPGKERSEYPKGQPPTVLHFPAPASPARTASLPITSGPQATPNAIPTPQATPRATLPPPAATPIPATTAERKTPVWPWIVGLGALLALLVWFFKRCGK